MKFLSKKTSLIILGIASLVCSRAVFFFINDPEGPNLLIVVVLAAIIFFSLRAIYFIFSVILKKEEYLDLVDFNDTVIGKEKRAVIYQKGLTNYRVVNAFIVNSEGKLWIPRRTAHKAIAPLALDMSAGGHVESGSTYEETFAKEVMEELNIDVAKVPWKEIGYFKAGEHGLKCFQKIYEIKHDEVPTFNADDFTEYYWLTPKELIAKIEAGDKAKSDLLILIKLLYLV